jgi:hypothetical protein
MVTLCPSVDGFGEPTIVRQRDANGVPSCAGGGQHWREEWRRAGHGLAARAAKAWVRVGVGAGSGIEAGRAEELPDNSQPAIASSKADATKMQADQSNMPIRARRRTLSSPEPQLRVRWRL